MRLIGWFLLLLVTLGWLSSEIRLAEPQSPDHTQSDWRYTVDGWEHRSLWTNKPTAQPPALHPAVVGALQLLLSTLALFAFPAKGRLRTASTRLLGLRAGPSPRSARHAISH